MSSDPILLKRISAGIFLVVVLFLILLMLDQLFRNDWKEVDLEQLILLPNEITLVLFIKLWVFCLILLVSLLLMAPILSLSLFIPFIALKTLYLTILLGTPTLVFLGGIARALTLGLRHSGLLIVLIIIPFYIPVLIFASSAVSLASMELSAKGALAWLGVLMILSISLAPFIINKIFRYIAVHYFYVLSNYLVPIFALSLFFFGVYGVIGGLYLAPADYQQGEAFCIIYVHVPSAFLSLFVYVVMAVFSIVNLIFRIKLAELIVSGSVCLGSWFTFLALLTGSVWAKPMWGAWWVWDAYFLSFFLLNFFP